MKKTRFTESQITGALKEHEAGKNVLDLHIFENIRQVKGKTEEFINDYNNNHPHDSLDDMSPIKFLETKYKEKMPAFTV